jgi:hypothetical protein
MKVYTKDKHDFLKNYEKFAGVVSWRTITEDKVEVKILVPLYSVQCKLDLEKIKD